MRVERRPPGGFRGDKRKGRRRLRSPPREPLGLTAQTSHAGVSSPLLPPHGKHSQVHWTLSCPPLLAPHPAEPRSMLPLAPRPHCLSPQMGTRPPAPLSAWALESAWAAEGRAGFRSLQTELPARGLRLWGLGFSHLPSAGLLSTPVRSTPRSGRPQRPLCSMPTSGVRGNTWPSREGRTSGPCKGLHAENTVVDRFWGSWDPVGSVRPSWAGFSLTRGAWLPWTPPPSEFL